MPWKVEFTDEFQEWVRGLTEAQEDAVVAAVDQLVQEGPNLGEPTVKRIVSSRLHHLKELRASKEGKLRILFAFDPRRSAILLIGGDKTGRWEEWYTEAIPEAERLYDMYLDELRSEGLI